jgi:O-antigen/teichoic acid export membrane protein
MARGMYWAMAGAVISRALMLLSSILVARLLGKTVYGELGMIQSTVGMFGVFAGFGLGLTATKYVAELKQNDPERVGRILALSTLVASFTGSLMALALWFFAPFLAEHSINAPHLAVQLRIGSVILFFSALKGSQTGALSGFEAFRVIAKINLLVGITSFPAMYFGAVFWGLKGVIWALVFNLFCNWLLNHIALRNEIMCNNINSNIKYCFKEYSVLLNYSLPAALSGMIVGPVRWLCGALLVNQPDGYGEMSFFNVANHWSTAILFFPGLVSQVVLPLLSSLNNKNNEKKYIKTLKVNIILTGISTSVIVVLVIFLSPYIVMLYGEEYSKSLSVIRIMAISSIIVAMNGVIGSSIASKGKMWLGLIFNSMWAFVLISLAYVFIEKGFGALGLAMATLIAYISHTFWQYYYVLSR